MKKAVVLIAACLITAAATACAMPDKENRGEIWKTKGEGNEPLFDGVPYFQDNTGRLVQTEDGYFYGYWGGVLARYDVDTLERTVLYEAGSEQQGDLFCLYGDYVYFWRCPISPLSEKRYCCTG